MSAVNARVDISNDKYREHEYAHNVRQIFSVSRTHFARIINKFIRNTDELLEDIASYKRNNHEVKSINSLRLMLRHEQDRDVLHVVVT